MTGYVPRRSREVNAERFATLREAIEAGTPQFANGGIVDEGDCQPGHAEPVSATWRTWLPHRATVGRLRVFQIVGGRRWSLALCVKPEAD